MESPLAGASASSGNARRWIPKNPTGTGLINIANGPSTNKTVTMALGTNAQLVCEAIHRQTGGTTTTVPTSIGTASAGCSNISGTYTAYANS